MNLIVISRRNGDADAAIDGCSQYATTVVIGVVPDKLDTSRGAGLDFGFTAECLVK